MYWHGLASRMVALYGAEFRAATGAGGGRHRPRLADGAAIVVYLAVVVIGSVGMTTLEFQFAKLGSLSAFEDSDHATLFASGVIWNGIWANTLALPAYASALVVNAWRPNSRVDPTPVRAWLPLLMFAGLIAASWLIGPTPTNAPPSVDDAPAFVFFAVLWAIPCGVVAAFAARKR